MENDTHAHGLDGGAKVWVLLGAKGGDNAQLLALARALELPFEAKQLTFNGRHRLPPVLLGASLASLAGGADALVPPWPDLVLAAGKRSAPVAHWIATEAAGRTRLVHLGRPWAPFEWFDLVVTTPQYRLPDAPNLVRVALPLNDAGGGAGADEIERWQQRWKDLPRPWTGVLVGGKSPSYALTVARARKLAAELDARTERNGGSALVVTSPRTPADAADALEHALARPHALHRFEPGADNPYRALLAVADRFAVTADSASMLAEAAASKRPVRVLSLDSIWSVRFGGLPHPRHAWNAWRSAARTERDLPGRLYDAAARAGWITPARELGEIHRALGLIDTDGDAIDDVVVARELLPAQELDKVATRVRALLGETA